MAYPCVSGVKTIFIWHYLTMLDISPEEPEIRRPAVTGHAIMLVRLGPTRVMKAHLGHTLFLVEEEADSRPLPIFLRADHF